MSELIEVVYWRYSVLRVRGCDSVGEALGFIEEGEDRGEMSSVGVFRDGEPVIDEGYTSQEPPASEERAEYLRTLYREAHGSTRTAHDTAHEQS